MVGKVSAFHYMKGPKAGPKGIALVLLLMFCFFVGTLSLDVSQLLRTAGATSSSPIVPLISGCGRSGTHSVRELLNNLGIRAIHEGAMLDGVSVSWFYGVNNSFTARDNLISFTYKNGEKMPIDNVDRRPSELKQSGVLFHPVIHVVRNPLKHIAATMRCICSMGDRHISENFFGWDKMSWDYIENYIDFPKDASAMMRSALYWLHWNHFLASVSVKTFRIEDLNPRELVGYLDLQQNKVFTSPDFNIESVPTSLKIRVAHHVGNKTRDGLTWKELKDGIGKEFTSNIIKSARAYGYTDIVLA